MADIVTARVVGDWRRVIGNHIPTPETWWGHGINGTATLTPQFGKKEAAAIHGDSNIVYTIQPLTCFVLWGELHDGQLKNPWQDIAVQIDGVDVRWRADFNLTYKHTPDTPTQHLTLAPTTFNAAHMQAGHISLTALH